jgi:hypothetical protein
MRSIIPLYGKVYHLWQVDRGDALPLGAPRLMTSVTAEGQLGGAAGFARVVGARDARLNANGNGNGGGVDWRRKREMRRDIVGPEVHADADWAWKVRE